MEVGRAGPDDDLTLLQALQDPERLAQLAHLRAIIAAKASGGPIEITLKSDDGAEWTSIRSSTEPQILAELIRQLPEDAPLQGARVHTANDDTLLLVQFQLGEAERFDSADPAHAERIVEVVAYAEKHDPEFTPEVARDCAKPPVWLIGSGEATKFLDNDGDLTVSAAVQSGPPAFGPVPDRPSPPNGWVPTTAPIWLRFT